MIPVTAAARAAIVMVTGVAQTGAVVAVTRSVPIVAASAVITVASHVLWASRCWSPRPARPGLSGRAIYEEMGR